MTESAGGLALTGYASVTQVDPDQIGLREFFYVATGHEVLKPKIYLQFPFVQYTHKYNANTQNIDFNAGGCRFWPSCESTKDKNPLRAELVLHYRFCPMHINWRYTDGPWKDLSSRTATGC